MSKKTPNEDFIVYYETDTKERLRYKLMIKLVKKLWNILLVPDEDTFIEYLKRSNCLWWVTNYYWLHLMPKTVREWELSDILQNKSLWLYSCKSKDKSWKELTKSLPNTQRIYRNERKPKKSTNKIKDAMKSLFLQKSK